MKYFILTLLIMCAMFACGKDDSSRQADIQLCIGVEFFYSNSASLQFGEADERCMNYYNSEEGCKITMNFADMLATPWKEDENGHYYYDPTLEPLDVSVIKSNCEGVNLGGYTCNALYDFDVMTLDCPFLSQIEVFEK